MRIKTLVSFFSLALFSVLLFAQKQEQILYDSIHKKVSLYEANHHFKIASNYFMAKKWDSVLIHTKKLTNNNLQLDISDYSKYYRGISFQKKKLFIEAKKELEKITQTFDFYHLSRIILGEIALAQERYQEAIDHFSIIQNLDKNKIVHLKVSLIEQNIGVCYIHLEKYDKANFYLLKSIKAQELAKDTIQLIGSYGNIASAYYNQYKDDIAIPNFEKALDLARKFSVKSIRSFQVKSEAAKNMSIVEENRKDFAKALAYLKEFEQWNDSLHNENKIWENAQVEKRFEIAKKQEEINILDADNKIKIAERNGFIYSSIFLLILLGTSIYFYRKNVKNTKVISDQKEALNTLNATKDYLFSVVSHDLRSPANILRKQHQKLKKLMLQNDTEKLKKTIETSATISESMYGLLNNILHWSLEQSKQLLFIPKTSAVSPILEQVVYDFTNLAAAKSIVLTSDIKPTFLAHFDRESLKVVIRNILDNAIKYTPEHGKIHIKMSATTHQTTIEIADSGIGFSPEQHLKINDLTTITMEKIDRSKGVGLGLLLCATLIKKNNGVLSIEQNKPKGSIVKIILPKD